MSRAVSVVLVGVLALVLFCGGVARADRIDDLSVTLKENRDEKARIAAAVSLGRIADQRGVPVLSRALGDRSPVVRGVAATALGHIGDARAIPALERSLSDQKESVRLRARDAIAMVRDKQARSSARSRMEAGTERGREEGGRRVTSVRVAPGERPRMGEHRAVVVVKTMSNRVPRTSRSLGAKLREHVLAELAHTPTVTTESSAEPGAPRFMVDGAITDLSRRPNGPWVEVTCKVNLTVSNANGQIVSIVTGTATVQQPRGGFRPAIEPRLQAEALENAVRSAHGDLVAFLGRQAATR